MDDARFIQSLHVILQQEIQRRQTVPITMLQTASHTLHYSTQLRPAAWEADRLIRQFARQGQVPQEHTIIFFQLLLTPR